jgi:hypothetical protein
MTIDQVRDAVRTDSVRRLVDAAPSAEDLRAAIAEGIEALGDGIGTVAERVDQSTELLRDRVSVPDPLGAPLDRLAALPVELGLRPAPRRTIGPVVAIVVGLAVGLVVAAIVIRLGRRPFDAVRERMAPLIERAAERAGLPQGEQDVDEMAAAARDAVGEGIEPARDGRPAVGLEIETRPASDPSPVGTTDGAAARSALGRPAGRP